MSVKRFCLKSEIVFTLFLFSQFTSNLSQFTTNLSEVDDAVNLIMNNIELKENEDKTQSRSLTSRVLSFLLKSFRIFFSADSNISCESLKKKSTTKFSDSDFSDSFSFDSEADSECIVKEKDKDKFQVLKRIK